MTERPARILPAGYRREKLLLDPPRAEVYVRGSFLAGVTFGVAGVVAIVCMWIVL